MKSEKTRKEKKLNFVDDFPDKKKLSFKKSNDFKISLFGI